MEMNELVNLIVNNGAAVVIIVYFMYRDYHFMSQMQETLTTLVNTVGCLEKILDSKSIEIVDKEI